MRHGPLLFLSTVLFISEVCSLPVPSVRNLHARFDAPTDSIFVEWSWAIPNDNVQFVVRYRVTKQEQWTMARTAEMRVRLNLPDIHDGEEVQVQVQALRGGQVIEDWSQMLIITISKKLTIGGVAVDANEPLPPLDFTAHVLSPSSVRLEWSPSETKEKDLFYVVNVKQLTSESGGALHRQQIKTSATSFTLGRLIPGESYEMTIRTGIPPDRVSTTAAIVEINMPLEEEYFEIGNLIITSHFKSNGHGTVNLTWEVPEKMADKILNYDVQYIESTSDGPWSQVQFHGKKASATLNNLKSDTEYLLKIKTTLRNNLVTESGQFKFRTPAVPPNPINKVDVIHAHEANQVRLQWILEPHVDVNRVGGYDVYLSDDKDKPDSQWKFIRLDNKEAALNLDDLRSSTVYYVRVNVRYTDGSVLKAPSVYRFKTMDHVNPPQEVKEANSLSYRNIGPGQVLVSWTYPENLKTRIAGATVSYSDNKELPLEQWRRIQIDDPKTTKVILAHLREGTRYHVKIVPRLITGEHDIGSGEAFELRTDQSENSVQSSKFAGTDPSAKPIVLPSSRPLFHKHRAHPVAGQHPPLERMQQLQAHPTKEHMRIVSCLPDAIVTGCAWDERCIARVEDSEKGWCISHSLRDSILNS